MKVGDLQHSVNAAIKHGNTIIHILRLTDQKAGRPSSNFRIQNNCLEPVLLASYIFIYFRKTVTGQILFTTDSWASHRHWVGFNKNNKKVRL